MAIQSDGSYGIPKGLIFSFPVELKDGKYNIVKDLPINEYYAKLIEKTKNELLDERKAVEHLLK